MFFVDFNGNSAERGITWSTPGDSYKLVLSGFSDSDALKLLWGVFWE